MSDSVTPDAPDMASGRAGVASGHPVTAAAAIEILDAGGNAFDAALAGFLVACVAEPVLTSLAGGGFLLARRADGDAVVFDFFTQTPGRRQPGDALEFYPVLADFGTTQQEFHIGRGAIAVPGAVDGLFAVHGRLGRMPLRDLAVPAIRLAKGGVETTAFQAGLFGIVGPIYRATPEARALYCAEGDRLPEAGQRIRNPDFADFLDVLVLEGPDLFYRGEVARRLCQDCADAGVLRMADLETYETILRKPLTSRFAGADVLINPPPSLGGLLVAYALKLLEAVGGAAPGGATGRAARLLEVMMATAEMRRDVRPHELSPEEALETVLQPARLNRAAAAIDHAPPVARRGTTHVSVIDREGNAASLTVSNGEGAGYILPGTGMMMNNMLGEEDVNPGGFHRWPENTRLASMMAPAIVLGTEGITALGSGGSNRIRTAVLQVIVNLLARGMTPTEAVLAPRFHWERGHLDVEPGFPAETVDALTRLVPDHRVWPDRAMFFGGVHVVRRDSGGHVTGVGDPRRDGQFRPC